MRFFAPADLCHEPTAVMLDVLHKRNPRQEIGGADFIPSVLRLGDASKIADPIVQRVAVDVINDEWICPEVQLPDDTGHLELYVIQTGLQVSELFWRADKHAGVFGIPPIGYSQVREMIDRSMAPSKLPIRRVVVKTLAEIARWWQCADNLGHWVTSLLLARMRRDVRSVLRIRLIIAPTDSQRQQQGAVL